MKRAVTISLSLAALGLAGTIISAIVTPTRTYFSYLAAFLFGVTIIIAGLVWLMIGHVSKASWFSAQRRLVEAVTDALPLYAILFIPIAVFSRRIYPWAMAPEAMDEALRFAVERKAGWLNVPFFVLRSAIYFAVFIVIAAMLRAWSIRSDTKPSVALVERLRGVSAATMPIIAFAITFASFDWSMSLEPQWSSTMFGFYFFAGGFAGAMGLVVLLVYLATAHGPLAGITTPDQTHALGRVLFTSVVFWAYIAFGQLIVIWIADIPEESRFYIDRIAGSWTWITWLLVLTHFVGPFLLLLSRDLKRRPRRLAAIGVWVVAAHYVDIYWQVMPKVDTSGVRPHWGDATALLFIGGLTSAVIAARFARFAPVPTNDPELKEGIHYEAAL